MRDSRDSTPAIAKSAVGGDISSMKRVGSGRIKGVDEVAAIASLCERHKKVMQRFRVKDTIMQVRFVRVKGFGFAAEPAREFWA